MTTMEPQHPSTLATVRALIRDLDALSGYYGKRLPAEACGLNRAISQAQDWLVRAEEANEAAERARVISEQGRVTDHE